MAHNMVNNRISALMPDTKSSEMFNGMRDERIYSEVGPGWGAITEVVE